MRFKLRTLFAVMTMCAILALPTFNYCKSIVEAWQLDQTPLVVIEVPEGGIIIMGGRTYQSPYNAGNKN